MQNENEAALWPGRSATAGKRRGTGKLPVMFIDG
jgi:hypothetical protein